MNTTHGLEGSFEKARRDDLVVEKGAKILMGSNTPVKRRDAASAFQQFEADAKLRYIKDFLPVLPNAAEDTGVGEGNVGQKTDNAHEALARVGYDEVNSFVYNTDIVIEFEQPDLHEHPFLKDYKHLYIDGQNFPGTEMAPMALVNGFETLMHDINRALNDIEEKHGTVDRGLKIKTVGEFSRVGSPETAITVAGRRDYVMLREPMPAEGEEDLGVYDLDYFLAFPDKPDVSVQSQKDEMDVACHPDSHNARAVKKLIETVGIPIKSDAKREFSAPGIILHPKSERGGGQAVIVTDRHFTGTWGREAHDPYDNWVKSQIGQLERHGYRLADIDEFDTKMPFHQQEFLPDGPSTDISCLVKFMQQVDGVVFLPFKPTGNIVEDTMTMLKRDMLFNMRRDLHNLGDGHVKGRPDVVLDSKLVDRHLHLLRLGTTAMRVASAFQIHRDGEQLFQTLNRGWENHEYVMTPFEPQDSTIKAVVPEFTDQPGVAFIGNATSENPEVLDTSYQVARLFYENGYAGSEGHGGKGSMNQYARAAVDLSEEGYEITRRGITTPIATMEGDPKGAREHGFIPISVPHMAYRIPGIIAPDIRSVIVDKGGPGTQTEWNYSALDNVNRLVHGLEQRGVVINNAAARFREGVIYNYQNLPEQYGPAQMKLMNSAMVHGGAEEMFRVAQWLDTQTANRAEFDADIKRLPG